MATHQNKSRLKSKRGRAVKKEQVVRPLAIRSTWKQLRRVAIAIASAIPLTLLFSTVGVFRHLETPALDAQMHLRPVPDDSDVVIVRITNDDYKNIFAGKSPLDPTKLQDLINAVAKGNPRVIGVDIDTAPPQFQSIQIAQGAPPIIWAREATFSDREKKFFLLDVLGGKKPAPDSGIVQLKLDRDRVLRTYRRVFDTDIGPFPSFGWAVMKEYHAGRGTNLKESHEYLLIEFTGGHSHRFDLPALEVMRQSERPNWPSNGILKDKIVLIGGSYAGQDEHDTPLGTMVGVEVLAQVVETELRGGGTIPPGSWLIILLGIIAGFASWLLFELLRFRMSLLLSILVIPTLALLCSLLAFRTISRWAHFLPILAVVLALQLYEKYKEWHKLTKRTPLDQKAGSHG